MLIEGDPSSPPWGARRYWRWWPRLKTLTPHA